MHVFKHKYRFDISIIIKPYLHLKSYWKPFLTSFPVLRVAAEFAVLLLSSPGWASSGSTASCRIPLVRDGKSNESPLPLLSFTDSALL